MDATFFEAAADFRRWLDANHDRAKEVWVGLWKKGSGRTGMTYAEAVDEGLCYGWIDSIVKTIDAASYANRFTPRKPRSSWTATNVKRVGELSAAGRMHTVGLAVFEARKQ